MSDEFNYIDRIAGLIIKYHRDEISELEYRELMEWRNQSEENRELFDRLSNHDYVRVRHFFLLLMIESAILDQARNSFILANNITDNTDEYG